MNKLIELIEELLDDYSKKMCDYYKSPEYLRNYDMFPLEENYQYAYADDPLFLQTIAQQYGYGTVDDLLDTLYNNWDIETIWNTGYYYNPHNRISFGYYRIDEIEIEIPEHIADMIHNQDVDINDIQCDIALHEYDGQITGYLYICGGVSFELPTKKAIEYLSRH